MCGTARRDARIAGNSVSSNAACHSASDVSSMSGAAGRADVVDEHVEAAERRDGLLDQSCDARVGRDVRLHGEDRLRRRPPPHSIGRRRQPLAPRAQMTTRQPSATSARALASPARGSAGHDGDLVSESRGPSLLRLRRQTGRPVRSFSRQSNSRYFTLNSFLRDELAFRSAAGAAR